MVKTLTLSFEDGQHRMLARARDLHDASSWEKFILDVVGEWYDMKREEMEKHI